MRKFGPVPGTVFHTSFCALKLFREYFTQCSRCLFQGLGQNQRKADKTLNIIQRIFHYWTFSLSFNHVNISLVFFTFAIGVKFLCINVSETVWDAYSYADMKRVFSHVTMHNSAYNLSIVSCEFTFRPRLACERAFFISMTSVVVLSYAKHIFLFPVNGCLVELTEPYMLLNG